MNFFDQIPKNAAQELFATLLVGDKIRIDDQVADLIVGDGLNLPAGTRHRVEKPDETRRTVGLAVFCKTGYALYSTDHDR